MRISRGFLVFSLVLLVACTSFITPLWHWINTDSDSIAAVPLPDGGVLSVALGKRWSDHYELYVTELDESGAAISQWEFDRELAPDHAAEADGNVFFANGFGRPLTRFDLQTGTSEAISLALPEGTTDARVSNIHSMDSRLLVLGSALQAGTDDEYLKSFWLLSGDGEVVDMDVVEDAGEFRSFQALSDGSFAFRNTGSQSSGIGGTVFRYSEQDSDVVHLAAGDRYAGVDAAGVFAYRESAEGNHIRHISWGGQLISVWMSDYSPYRALRTVADDVIVVRRGDLQRIAPDGAVVWSQALDSSSLEPGDQVYTHFDLSEYATAMVGPDGDILVGIDRYQGRVHGLVDGQLWIRNQMTVVFERFDTDGNIVKTYQDEPYTRIMQPSTNCYDILCGWNEDRVENAGACQIFDAAIDNQNRLLVRNRHCAGILHNFGQMITVYDY